MAEILAPTSPPSIISYRIEEMLLSKRYASIKIIVVDSEDRVFPCSYRGATAITKIRQLNTANLSTTSLEKRVLEMLSADGQLPVGNVTGTPDTP